MPRTGSGPKPGTRWTKRWNSALLVLLFSAILIVTGVVFNEPGTGRAASPATGSTGYCRAAVSRMAYPAAAVPYAIPFSDETPTDFAVAPDGSVWFTQPVSNIIGHITVTGTTTYAIAAFHPPTASAEPRGLAITPDGSRVWVAEAGANALGELNTATGAIVEHTLPLANSRPTDVDLAPSGRVWFTEENANRIGRFDPGDSSYQDYRVPTYNSAPHSLAVAGEDLIWFTESQGQKLGRLRPSFAPNPGTFVEVLSAGDHPYDIALDSLGDPWFTDIEGNQIGWYQAGTLQVTRWYSLEAGQVRPAGIAFDSSNRPWFTDSAGAALLADRNVGNIERFPAATTYNAPAGIAVHGNIVWYPTSVAARCLYIPLIREH